MKDYKDPFTTVLGFIAGFLLLPIPPEIMEKAISWFMTAPIDQLARGAFAIVIVFVGYKCYKNHDVIIDLKDRVDGP